MPADEDFARRIRELLVFTDYEAAHSEGDDILCEALEHAGYTETVAAFKEARQRWYYA